MGHQLALSGGISCVSLVIGQQVIPLQYFIKLNIFAPWRWPGREFPLKIHPPPGHNLSALTFNHYCLQFHPSWSWMKFIFHHPTPAAHAFMFIYLLNHLVKFSVISYLL